MEGSENETNARSKVAQHVLVLSGIGIVVIAVVLMIVTGVAGEKKDLVETTRTVFNSLLPLFGTWVGTVIAYFFSKVNFEVANQSVKSLVALTVDQRLEKLKIKDEMIPAARITSVVIPSGKAEKDILLDDLRKKLDRIVSRIPILDDKGVLKYMLHESVLFKVIAEAGIAQGSAGKPLDVRTLALDKLVSDATLKAMVTAVAYVAIDATVAVAKGAMERTEGCQDVVVTQTGANTEPMLGWLTNVDLGRLAKAK